MQTHTHYTRTRINLIEFVGLKRYLLKLRKYEYLHHFSLQNILFVY